MHKNCSKTHQKAIKTQIIRLNNLEYSTAARSAINCAIEYTFFVSFRGAQRRRNLRGRQFNLVWAFHPLVIPSVAWESSVANRNNPQLHHRCNLTFCASQNITVAQQQYNCTQCNITPFTFSPQPSRQAVCLQV